MDLRCPLLYQLAINSASSQFLLGHQKGDSSHQCDMICLTSQAVAQVSNHFGTRKVNSDGGLRTMSTLCT
ncbi:hypothetical protein Tco_1578156 [Tanacetum coccineum]